MNTRIRIKGVCNITLINVKSVYRNRNRTNIDYNKGSDSEFLGLAFDTTEEQHALIEQGIHDYLEAQETQENKEYNLQELKHHLLSLSRNKISIEDLQKALYNLSDSIQ